MSKISIDALYPAGTHFFAYSENFLDDLTEEGLMNTFGGLMVSATNVTSTFHETLTVDKSILCLPTNVLSYPPR